MKISIIIPVYNVAPYIKACLLSALNQSYEDLEIIVVDDCGSDNSMEIAHQVVENHPKKDHVIFLKQKINSGPSASRNIGTEKASGDYIFYLDGDDEMTMSCLENLSAPLKNQPFDFVIGKYIVNNQDQDYSQIRIKGAINGRSEILGKFTAGEFNTTPWNKLINKEFLITNNLFFNEELKHEEDELWCFQVACCANTIFAINESTYIYKIRSSSLHVGDHTDNLFVVIGLMLQYSIEKHLFFEKHVFSYLYWYLKSWFQNYYTVYDDQKALSKYKEIKRLMPNALVNIMLFKCSWGQFKLMWHYMIPAKYGYRLFKKKLK